MLNERRMKMKKSIDTAMHILYNMRDYITNPLNTKYEFTHRRSTTKFDEEPFSTL